MDLLGACLRVLRVRFDFGMLWCCVIVACLLVSCCGFVAVGLLVAWFVLVVDRCY